jgi:hypothetical protein
MVSLIQSVYNFLENALYHSSCIANYLLNMKSDTVPVEKESEHASAFQQFIDSIQDDLFINLQDSVIETSEGKGNIH